MKTSNHTWFIHAFDAHTNEVISQSLGEESAQRDLMCEDGELRNLWQCDKYSLVKEMIHNKGIFNLRFSVYVREGKYGKIKLWKFSSKKKKKKLK